MIVQPAIPGGHVVFCDEVRQEISGKLLYIGVYNADMVIAAPAPVVLGQLCCVVSLRLPPVDTKTKLVLKMLQSGRPEPLVEIEGELNAEDVTAPVNVQPVKDDQPDTKTITQMFSVVAAQNIEITEDCVLRIKAYIGDDEVRLGALRVRVAGPTEQGTATHE